MSSQPGSTEGTLTNYEFAQTKTDEYTSRTIDFLNHMRAYDPVDKTATDGFLVKPASPIKAKDVTRGVLTQLWMATQSNPGTTEDPSLSHVDITTEDAGPGQDFKAIMTASPNLTKVEWEGLLGHAKGFQGTERTTKEHTKRNDQYVWGATLTWK